MFVEMKTDLLTDFKSLINTPRQRQRQDEIIRVVSFQIAVIIFAWRSFDANVLFFFFLIIQTGMWFRRNSLSQTLLTGVNKIRKCLHIFCLFVDFTAIKKTKPNSETVFYW